MWTENLKRWWRGVRYGGIYKIVEEQTSKIHELQQLNKAIYNSTFDSKYGKLPNQSVYHGPMQELKDCRVISTHKSEKKLKQLDMIEVAEFNGYNGATYFWYFAKEAAIIYPQIYDVPVEEKGEQYVPKTRTNKAVTAQKVVKPQGESKQ
jgi:hypothetical protein